MSKDNPLQELAARILSAYQGGDEGLITDQSNPQSAGFGMVFSSEKAMIGMCAVLEDATTALSRSKNIGATMDAITQCAESDEIASSAAIAALKSAARQV